jgi:hypothetical protein
VVVVFAVVLLAEQSHALHYKTRATYGGAQPVRQARAYNVPAKIVVLLPTMTEECDINSCSRVVGAIQKNDMINRRLNDLAEK